MEKEGKIKLQRTEEIQEIIDRMPSSGVRWVVGIILGLVISMFLSGFLIYYPEMVTGNVTITMQTAPIRLVCKQAGKLKLLGTVPRIKVKEGEIFALVDNSANLEHIKLLDSLIKINRIVNEAMLSIYYPDTLNVGNLNNSYYHFLNIHNKYINYVNSKVYEIKQNKLEDELRAAIRTYQNGRERLNIKKKQLEFSQKEVARDSLLFKIGDYIEREFERTKNVYHSMLLDFHALKEQVEVEKLRIKTLRNELKQLCIEQLDYETELVGTLRDAYTSLQANIGDWKEKFVFCAPFNGYLEFLEFWHEDDFVAAGKEIFTVIPEKNPIIGHVLLPSKGAGKVKKGQKVTVKLDDYPYLEYGIIEGKVDEISLTTNKTSLAVNNVVDTYLVTVVFPDGLITKYGSSFDLGREFKGSADIRTKSRRLIGRLFDNLKYLRNN